MTLELDPLVAGIGLFVVVLAEPDLPRDPFREGPAGAAEALAEQMDTVGTDLRESGKVVVPVNLETAVFQLAW